MIEFTKPDTVDCVRRLSLFVRTDGITQWMIAEASMMTWVSQWLIMGIDGEDLRPVPLLYPSWLHNVSQAFGMERQDPMSGVFGKTYKKPTEPNEIRVYAGASALQSDLDHKPSKDHKSYVAAKVPAGKVITWPFAIKFTKPAGINATDCWIPVLKDSQDVQVYCQMQHAHGETPSHEVDDRWNKSDYQACVYTRSDLTNELILSNNDLYMRHIAEDERESQWLTM